MLDNLCLVPATTASMNCMGKKVLEISGRVQTSEQKLLVKQMGARQLSGSFHLLPANGTIIGILCEIVSSCQWIALLHVIQHPQIIAVLTVFTLNFMRQITELHHNDQTSHGQEYVAP